MTTYKQARGSALSARDGTASRERHAVELVNEQGLSTGVTTVAEAHRAPGRLHRAFSVLLIDDGGRILLQQRAAEKTRFPMRWANSCCGHPAPGEAIVAAANRRLGEELGVGPVPLTEIGVHLYYAEDPATGRVEHEFDHVLLGTISASRGLSPDPREVAQLRWIAHDLLRTQLATNGQDYAPWLVGVAGLLFAHTESTPGGGPSVLPERTGG